ncbi:MAG: FecR domain-containing protein [Proteobacteria bacterium]|nr:FecR domain-containing protein [Pseudomonadota bacterium]
MNALLPLRHARAMRTAVAAMLMLCAAAVQAQAGRVVLAVGDVTAVRGADRIRLAAGATVASGDAVVTGANSHAQIRFADDALVALKPDTEFRIEQFVYNGHPDGNERAVFRLVRGGFRTVSGQIGKVDHDRYSVLTTQATIGIRGTHYVLQECADGQCREAPDSPPAPPGLYGGVLEGAVGVDTPFGNDVFGIREYFFVPDGHAPERLLGPRTFLADALHTTTQVASTAPVDLEFSKVPAFPLAFAQPSPPFTYQATEDLNFGSPIGGSVAWVVGSDRYTLELGTAAAGTSPLLLDGAGGMVGFTSPTLNASLGSATLADTGSAPDAGSLNWGRWEGPGSTIAQTLPDGIVVTNNGGNLHYIYGQAATNIPSAGVVSFSPVGGTRPTDSGTGATGTLLSGGLVTIDFGAANLSLTGLTVGFTGATYTMSGSTSLVGPLFSTSGLGATTSCTGANCQSVIAGNFSGFLTGPGVTGVGLDYYFNTRIGGVIEGVVGYGRCSSPKCS